ncbi:MAG TPA: hypothetical protein VNK96_07390 [Fimbriimonadales bacterium]|nr:hypothetical protein [Fimbriimonadales bacterium]
MLETNPLLDCFHDKEWATGVIERLGGFQVPNFWQRVLSSLAQTPNPDRALANLERWLFSAGNSYVRASLLVEDPGFRHRFLMILGSGQGLADSLIQNPEMSTSLADYAEISSPPNSKSLIKRGIALLENTSSFSHRLDRIRFLKQETLLKIAAADLTAEWEQETVWEALSELADAILHLVFRAVSQELGSEFPVAVIAMGKHGSRELNYSSDIDLIFLVQDDYPNLEAASKFCEKLTRALVGKMGRGSLYRVDLRLRPFGKSGPISHTLTAALNYYRNYAEPWEIQALVRARPCAGDKKLGENFVREIADVVYSGARSEFFLDSLLSAKKRYEQEIQTRGEWETNIKLGRGGIRDVEFITQVLQLLAGSQFRELQGAPTLDALSTLEANEILSEREANILENGYRILRQLEHRIQLLYDLQEHTLPKEELERKALCKMMHSPEWTFLEKELMRIRTQIREILERRIAGLAKPSEEVVEIITNLGYAYGSSLYRTAKKLIESSEDASSFTHDFLNDTSTLDRFRLIVENAPIVVPHIAFHKSLWDVAFSEEVEISPEDESDVSTSIYERLKDAHENWESALAWLLRRELVISAIKDGYHKDTKRTFKRLTRIAEAALLASLDRIGGKNIDIVALGRLGSEELLFGSDWDVILLVKNTDEQTRAEKVGEEWIRCARRMSTASSWFPLDSRLRPEGRSGLVVRSLQSLLTYGETAGESWERMAYTRARSLRGWRETQEALREFTYGPPWREEDEKNVMKIRQRIHNERVQPKYRNRNLKLSEGFLLDIEWICGLLKLRSRGEAASSPSILKTLKELKDNWKINLHEEEKLSEAMLFFSRLRNALFLLDMDSDVILPENLDKLNRIAAFLGYETPNDVLKKVEEMRNAVRSAYESLIGEH